MDESNGGSLLSANERIQQDADMTASLWQINIMPRNVDGDWLTREINLACREAGMADADIRAVRGYLVQGELNAADAESLASGLFADGVVERFVVGQPGDSSLNPLHDDGALFHVLPGPGVTDAEAETALMAARQMGFDVHAVRTFRQYHVIRLNDDHRAALTNILANDSVEQLIEGPIQLTELQLGRPSEFQLNTVPIRGLGETELQSLSRDWQLSLTLIEMQTIQQHYQSLGREPTDVELETIAQTWSEHCSHKTLAGRIEYTDENGSRVFENMLKETIFAATMAIRSRLGDDDWCVSVFKDNAGIVCFDDETNVTFKVETHNRPSAIEPYGGANTGIGGVIRDTLGTGMGAKPICNTDVFCFADPSTPNEDLPPGVLHPRRVMRGVVSGVRDYGNRMGIPTINGAVYFDQRYVGNPLVFCGSVGLLPRDRSFKQPQPNDLIVAIGGRTGRDGIRGATFSSAELTETSDVTSGGAVQIGNAITEKMLMDVLLAARDENLYNAVTDCGAGGFSSAVGEMGEEIGAEVWLEKAPLKYEGLTYTEIWISEAQERMVFAVPEANWQRFQQLCASESVEASIIGRFCPTGELHLKYAGQTVGRLSMEFMHYGRPRVVRKAVYESKSVSEIPDSAWSNDASKLTRDLFAILGCLNVASKHWIIRQYDHEVQGGSVIKPLVGPERDGPSDAAVVRPRLHSRRGLAVACGMNPHFGDLDPFHMAASSIDEAIRNCVAVGADPDRIAILDNFCWGYTDRPETLGSLVRAAIACEEIATAFGTPFISGKDSLNNEFSFTDNDGQRQTISIPATLLISALGQIDDVHQCVTMDLKRPGNLVYLIGETKNELGGSHWCIVNGVSGGKVPRVNAAANLALYRTLHKTLVGGMIRSCHDLSEGGLAVAAAEMAFAGGYGIEMLLDMLADELECGEEAILFGESNGRFLCEVTPDHAARFESMFGESARLIGEVNDSAELNISFGNGPSIQADIHALKTAWLSPLDWS